MKTTSLVQFAAATVALGLTAACAPEPGQGDFPSFVREPADRPVIGSGVAGLPTIVGDPCVLADADGYHLFYSAFFCHTPDGVASFSFDPQRPEDCSFEHAFGTTAYAFSADRGLTWEMRSTPVVTPGAHAWEGRDVETPWVVRTGDRLHLLYSAVGGPSDPLQLGAATLTLNGRSVREALLTDQAVFETRPAPLIAADTDTPFGVTYAQEPSVVASDGRLELFFVSLGLSRPGDRLDAPNQEARLALRVAVFGQDLAPLAPPSAPIATGVAANIPEVRAFDGRYHLFATTTETDNHEDDLLTYSVSDDGRQFTAPKTILRRRSGDAFDNWGLMAPTVVAEDDEVVLFYTAWESQAHHCVWSGPGGRLGTADESRPQDARCLYGTLGRAVSPR